MWLSVCMCALIKFVCSITCSVTVTVCAWGLDCPLCSTNVKCAICAAVSSRISITLY
jgi:hypothetical protein